MKTILFILQNGYRSEKYCFRNYEEWYCDLKRSYSGKRLAEMIPNNANIKVINATPMIGDCANSYFKADISHLEKMIKSTTPDIICACGKEAQNGCKQLGIDFIALPHPAWRQLSKVHTNEIRENIQSLL